MTARDELVTAAKAEIERMFVEYGDEAGSGIHSWRCNYPDRYGPCSCREQFAADVAARVAGGVPSRSEAEVKAEALREAAEAWSGGPTGFAPIPHGWLRDRAARLAKEDDE